MWQKIFEFGKMLWYGDEYLQAARAHHQMLLQEAASYAVSYTQAKLSIPGRSLPGEYPGQDTSALKNSVYAGIDAGKLQARIATNLAYGYYLEYGTAGGRIIYARPGGWLRWRDPVTGQYRFAKWVRQGRIAPRPWMSRAAEELKPWLRAHFSRPPVWPPTPGE